VKEAQSLQEEGNRRIAKALEDQENKLSHGKACRCIIGDFCQNCGLPHLGARQAGDMYYYTPLTCNAFGIIDYMHILIMKEWIGREVIM
jgi:membrane protease subunit (stomatin/prohibitin family)